MKAGSEESQYQKMLEAFYAEMGKSRDAMFGDRDPGSISSGKAIIELPLEERPAMLRCVLREIRDFHDRKIGGRGSISGNDYWVQVMLKGLIGKLMRAALPLEESDLERLLACAETGHWPGELVGVGAVLRAVEQHQEGKPPGEAVLAGLRELRGKFNQRVMNTFDQKPTKEIAGYLDRIDILLGKATGARSVPKVLDVAEPWAMACQQDVLKLSGKTREAWDDLLMHLQTADGSKPSKKWLAEVDARVKALGRERFQEFLVAWLPRAAEKCTARATPTSEYSPDENQLFSDVSHVTLKGLAWAGSLIAEPDVSAALGDLGEACWKKVTNFGPRSKLAGNGVLWALSTMAGEGAGHAAAQLTRINSKLKHASARKLADKALNRAAELSGQTREDLEEAAVPAFGLDATGALERKMGEYRLTLTIDRGLEVEQRIVDGSGKERKSVPVELKSNHAVELKAWQRTEKDLKNLLQAQRLRVESLLRFPERTWSYADWQDRYMRHPVLARLASRLIWKFTGAGGTAAAMPIEGKLTGADDGSPAALKPADRVALWHPCTETVEAVRGWRQFLERRQIRQPFKQAHREVYLLTEAERRTDTYSNRFAAHILRQHQFNALCAARGWTYKLQGSWDGGNPTPTLDLPSLNLKVEFWVEPVGGAGIGDDGVSGTGVAFNLVSDQVRFHRREPNEQIPLAEVPAQIFSEVMRDVDLFVGVCSVGNDPTWADGGPEGRYREYWQSFSFGDLNASAQTRREILQTLIPRLAIAGKCSLLDKFLRVQGRLRAYKIHLGSGNILMEPNDQYLCIVADRSVKGGAADLYLPFEGDTTLAVILSKAFLLANDATITDETITRQIKGP